MRLFIRNSASEEPHALDVRQGDSIAAVKAKYRRSAFFTGSRNFVQLQHAGRLLEDTATVKDYNLKDGAILYHPPSSKVQAAYSPVDYDAMALALEEENTKLRGGQDLADFDLSKEGGGEAWDATWRGGNDHTNFPPAFWEEPSPPPHKNGGDEGRSSSSIVLARAPGPVVAYGSGYSSTQEEEDIPPPRYFRNLYVAQIGRFQFRLLHRMEGRWNGDATVQSMFAPTKAQSRVCAVSLSFDDRKGHWVERQTLTTSDGVAKPQTLIYKPVGDGVCQVFTQNNLAWEDCDIKLEEKSEHVLMLTATSHSSGKPLIVETVTVIDDYRRVRTIQRFDPIGNFQCLYLMRENRVIDKVSGAMSRRKSVPEDMHSPLQSPNRSPQIVGSGGDQTESSRKTTRSKRRVSSGSSGGEED
eukprot:gb/GECG01008575.1/.p1 GENE.gb/GECG01008575.1/~~gb/GECG01008575.1/.p1  ORF type:complete len:413 (+),score=53.28 gb/GECG01008575.1/:1-1239(+)